ncbi:MAG: phage major capsid protein [Anaerovoracaceae bacterium]|jgi:HK97 family phage major capsid protein
MNTTMEMMEKRSKAWDAAKAFVETKADADGLLSEEDAKVYAEMEAKVKDFSKEIERLQAMEAMDAELKKPTTEAIKGKPSKGLNEPEKKGRASNGYREGMLQAFRTNFRQISNDLMEGIDPNGGYLVPEEYDTRIIDILNEENVMRMLGTTITTSGEHKINIAATKPAASWVEEGKALTFGDATFDQIILDAHKLHVAIKVTEELLYDNAFKLENYIIEQFGMALSNAEEDAFLNGDGKGRPTGVFTAALAAKSTVDTAAGTIASDDIINLVYKLKRPYRKNACFILNDQTMAEIRKLKDLNGAYIWQPSYSENEPDRILGFKAYTSPFAPTIEAGKPCMAFGDFSYYNIGDRGVRSFQELKELFAGNGMVGFLAKERVDAKLVLPEAVQLLNIKKA